MLYNVKIRQLRTYYALMQTKNTTSAGELLGLSQPTVSRQLAQLEESVGFPLFDRFGSGGLVPTQKGEQFYREIEGTLLGLEDIPAIAYGIRKNKGGRLKIAATTPMLNSSFLTQTIKAYCTAYPTSDLRIEWVPRHHIESLIAGRQVDIGLAALPSSHPNIQAQELIHTVATAVVHRDHPLGNEGFVEAEDLKDDRLILDRGRPLLPHFVNFGDFGTHMQTYQVDAQQALTGLRLVAAGLGATICDPLTSASFADPNIKVLPWHPEIELSYGYMIEKNGKYSTEVFAFVEVLADVAKQWSVDELGFLQRHES